MKYFFILGHQPELSLSEIESVLSPLTDFVIEKLSLEACVIETKKEINPTLIQERLGGTVKIGKIIGESKGSKISFSKLFNIADQICLDLKKSKINFGFSLYNLEIEPFNLDSFMRQINSLALKLKNKLKSSGLSLRWVSSKKRTLSSVIIKTNKILDNGFEIVFLFDSNNILWGQTLSCQDFRSYEIRDFKRPMRDIERGMIPLRLAKIMLNLCDQKKDYSQVVLDPFCGCGTILQEAIVLGYPNLIGCDQDRIAVEGTEENLKWLASFDFKFEANIFQIDSRKISQKIKPFSIDLIVTEPYLGPLRIRDWREEVRKISDLYLASFKEFKKILKPNGRICVIFPAFSISSKDVQDKNNEDLHFLPILEELKRMGWKIQPFLDGTERGSIVYSRPDQSVQREIFIFTNI